MSPTFITRSACLLIMLMVGVDHTEANIFSDVLSWVGIGGSNVIEKDTANNDNEAVEEEATRFDPDVVEEKKSLKEPEERLDWIEIQSENEEELTVNQGAENLEEKGEEKEGKNGKVEETEEGVNLNLEAEAEKEVEEEATRIDQDVIDENKILKETEKMVDVIEIESENEEESTVDSGAENLEETGEGSDATETETEEEVTVDQDGVEINENGKVEETEEGVNLTEEKNEVEANEKIVDTEERVDEIEAETEEVATTARTEEL